ncbi:hypothetical protein LCGC14_0717640 [marine sediment metagenome]|uniref:Uncharacterized protein n=1 Tax=marine sediment metagenome TaxID=412755 RepID=A0A0F9QHP1_9ZZZZ
MSIKVVNITIDGADQFSDPISPTYGHGGHTLNISILGSSGWDAEIHIQRRFGEGTWRPVDYFKTDFEGQVSDDEEGVQYRIGCPPGKYTSGDIEARLSK